MKKLLFGFVFLIILFQLIGATTTNINVKTVPKDNINVIALSSDLEVYGRFNENADEYGDASFAFSSDVSYFDLSILVKDLASDSKVAYKKLENQKAGEDIYIEVVPEGFKIIETPSNETGLGENLTSNESLTGALISENLSLGEDNKSFLEKQNSTEKKFTLSGLFIFGDKSKSEKTAYYIIGIVLLFIILFVLFRLFRKKISRAFSKEGTSPNIRIKKLSEWEEEKKENSLNPSNNDDGVLEDAQKKIDEAQKELAQLKNRSKIREAERKIQQDREELRKLKGE